MSEVVRALTGWLNLGLRVEMRNSSREHANNLIEVFAIRQRNTGLVEVFPKRDASTIMRAR